MSKCEHSFSRSPDDDSAPTCTTCGAVAECIWFEAIGVENRQCGSVADVDITLRYTDEDDNDTEPPFTIWLCQKHGKRLVMERAGRPIPAKYLDEPLIEEEP